MRPVSRPCEWANAISLSGQALTPNLSETHGFMPRQVAVF